MNRATERSVFILIIVALGGLVAGLTLAFTLAARTSAPTQEIAADDIAPPEVICALPSAAQTPIVEIEHQTYKVGQTIHFSISSGTLGESAWVGLIPSDVAHGDEATNDAHDVDYAYVTSSSKGQLTAPLAPGRYDLRLHNQYPNGTEIAHVEFVVEGRAGKRACELRRKH